MEGSADGDEGDGAEGSGQGLGFSLSMGTPSPPEGILGAKYLDSMVCAVLVSAKYS